MRPGGRVARGVRTAGKDVQQGSRGCFTEACPSFTSPTTQVLKLVAEHLFDWDEDLLAKWGDASWRRLADAYVRLHAAPFVRANAEDEGACGAVADAARGLEEFAESLGLVNGVCKCGSGGGGGGTRGEGQTEAVPVAAVHSTMVCWLRCSFILHVGGIGLVRVCRAAEHCGEDGCFPLSLSLVTPSLPSPLPPSPLRAVPRPCRGGPLPADAVCKAAALPGAGAHPHPGGSRGRAAQGQRAGGPTAAGRRGVLQVWGMVLHVLQVWRMVMHVLQVCGMVLHVLQVWGMVRHVLQVLDASKENVCAYCGIKAPRIHCLADQSWPVPVYVAHCHCICGIWMQICC